MDGVVLRCVLWEGVGGLPREVLLVGCLGVGWFWGALGVLGACHCVDAAGGAAAYLTEPPERACEACVSKC